MAEGRIVRRPQDGPMAEAEAAKPRPKSGDYGPYGVHPTAELFPLLKGAKFDALVESIRAIGLRRPIDLTPDGEDIADGRNRYRACRGRAAEQAAALVGISHAALSQAKRIEKEAPELLPKVAAGTLSLNAAYKKVLAKAEKAQEQDDVADTQEEPMDEEQSGSSQGRGGAQGRSGRSAGGTKQRKHGGYAGRAGSASTSTGAGGGGGGGQATAVAEEQTHAAHLEDAFVTEPRIVLNQIAPDRRQSFIQEGTQWWRRLRALEKDD